MSLRCSMTKINTLFPELVGAVIDKRRQLTMEVGAIIDGLALNSLFNPEALTVNNASATCESRQRRRCRPPAKNDRLRFLHMGGRRSCLCRLLL